MFDSTDAEASQREARTPDAGKATFRIEVGYDHGVKPGNIVGAIANEAGLDAKHIGRIEIFEDHTLLDLPEGMPPELLQHMQNVRVASRPLLRDWKRGLDREPALSMLCRPQRLPFTRTPG